MDPLSVDSANGGLRPATRRAAQGSVVLNCRRRQDRVKDLLPGRREQRDGIDRDGLCFHNAVLWSPRTGAAWGDLPESLGGCNSQWRRFDSWAAKGRRDPLLAPRDLTWTVPTQTRLPSATTLPAGKKWETVPAAKSSKLSVTAAAAPGPRSTTASTAWATTVSCS